MEAMSYSLPIVATNVGDNNRLVYHGQNGYIVDVKDFKQLANKLCELVISYEKRITFGLESYRIIKENYSFEVFQNKYIELIETLDLCHKRKSL